MVCVERASFNVPLNTPCVPYTQLYNKTLKHKLKNKNKYYQLKTVVGEVLRTGGWVAGGGGVGGEG